MSTARTQRIDFFKRYLDTDLAFGGLVTKRMKQVVRRVDTVIIDTASLALSQLTFVGVRHGNEELCLGTLARAAHQATGPVGLAISHAMPYDERFQPIVHHDLPVLHSLWHVGETFQLCAAGEPEQMMPYLNLTENEREHVLNEARRANGEGKLVYLTASRTATQNDNTLSDLSLDGLALFEPSLYPHAQLAVKYLVSRGLAVRYISEDSEQTVTTIARKVGLLTSHQSAVRGREVTRQSICVAECTNDTRQTLVEKYDKQTTIVCKDQLPKFIEMFQSAMR